YMAETSATVCRQASGLTRVVATLLTIAFLIYAATCAYFYFEQDQITFPAPAEYPPATPASVGIPFEDLHIPANRPEQIHAWWVPASPVSNKVLLVFHGNGYVLEQAATRELVPLHSLGTNLLMIDYRGYGSSSRMAPNEQRVYEDARAAFAYLVIQRKVPGRDIIFLGRSIGTGPATEMANEHPEAGGLILISPFTSTIDVAKTIWYLRLFPLSLLSHNRFDNLSKMDGVHIPVFISVGTADRLTPPAMAQALFARSNQPKRLYLSPGADHDDVMDTGVNMLEAQIRAFIQTIQ
ncbi:MAG: alpha/beta hydrolase, partial [Candidatus Acidiferrales bacterium]